MSYQKILSELKAEEIKQRELFEIKFKNDYPQESLAKDYAGDYFGLTASRAYEKFLSENNGY